MRPSQPPSSRQLQNEPLPLPAEVGPTIVWAQPKMKKREIGLQIGKSTHCMGNSKSFGLAMAGLRFQIGIVDQHAAYYWFEDEAICVHVCLRFLFGSRAA